MGLGQDQDPDVGQDPDLGFANTDQQGRARERKLQRKASSICEAPSCVSGVLPVHGEFVHFGCEIRVEVCQC